MRTCTAITRRGRCDIGVWHQHYPVWIRRLGDFLVWQMVEVWWPRSGRRA